MVFPPDSLSTLFQPRSVAIYGASNNPNKIGGRPLFFLRKAGYKGTIYPINPTRKEVQGMVAFAGLEHIPVVDQAIIALPAQQVSDALEACIAKGIKTVQIFSAGFAEVGQDGRMLQEQLRRRAEEADVRLLGPNSLGLFHVPSGFFGTFATALDGAWPVAGSIGMATQSGAFGSYIFALATARGLGFNSFVATGNEADIDVAESIAHYAQDDATHPIIALIEGCKNGERLMNALALAHERGKPVLVMKVGVSESGAAAAASHTGSLAGANAIYDAVFQQYHAYRATTIDELLDAAYVCTKGILPRTNRAAVITTSGGIGVLMADAASEHGLSLAPLTEPTRQHLKEAFPYVSSNNPVDTTAQLITDLSRYATLMDILAEDDTFDTVIGYLAHVGRNPQHFAQLKEPLYAVRRRFPEKLLVLCLLTDTELRAELEAEGFLVFEEPSRAIQAVSIAAKLQQGLQAKIQTVHSTTVTHIPDKLSLSASVNELEANRIVAEAGIPMIATRLATNADEAIAAAHEIGFPVVLKVLSPAIQHKSDVGGVILNLASEQAVRDGYEQIYHDVQRHRPDARIDGVLVSPMIQGGIECILGVQRDPVFGPVVMFGLGGIFVEVFRDVVFRVAPFSEVEALAMVQHVKGAALLRGTRGKPAADIHSLCRALANLSQFAYVNRDSIASIDINPLLALPERVVGVDALIIPQP